MLVRFQDILRHRVKKLNEAFNRAIAENKYRGRYRGVFPIKVNQLREVVEEILDAGGPITSASRSAASRSCSPGSGAQDNDSLIVCNGYKDDQPSSAWRSWASSWARR
jgi:arginine decarboxylase